MESVPSRFEQLLFDVPDAPAVVRVRKGGRRRVWSRAAVEHRAIRVAIYCTEQGLAAGARVSVAATDPVDRMGAIFFVLASGRILSSPERADLVLSPDTFGWTLGETQEDYLLRSVVAPGDPALDFGELLSHAELAEALLTREPLFESPLQRAAQALLTGEPLVFGPADAESASSAA